MACSWNNGIIDL